jgi:hypothetical protein
MALFPGVSDALLPLTAAPEDAFLVYGGQFALIKQLPSADPDVGYLVRARRVHEL